MLADRPDGCRDSPGRGKGARFAAEIPESLDAVDVGEGVEEELEEVEEEEGGGGKAVYGEIPGGTPRRNKGS